jgi:hypothetical protein
MKHFLLVYDRQEGKLVREEMFEVGEQALDRRFELELELQSRKDLEVVVLTAPSREALLATHARYFRTLGELAIG